MVKNLKKKKGFTLIELIIVIAILGILAAIAIPKFTDVQEKAKVSADETTKEGIRNAVDLMILNEDLSYGGAAASFTIPDTGDWVITGTLKDKNGTNYDKDTLKAAVLSKVSNTIQAKQKSKTGYNVAIASDGTVTVTVTP